MIAWLAVLVVAALGLVVGLNASAVIGISLVALSTGIAMLTVISRLVQL
jgi:hypothetical protein